MPRIGDENKNALDQLLDDYNALLPPKKRFRPSAASAAALALLNRTGLLTGDAAQANFNVVLGHQSPGCVADALYILNRADLLTGEAAQANFNAVLGHQAPFTVADTLYTLNRVGLLTGEAAQVNRNAVTGHQDLSGIVEALSTLNAAGLLTGDAAQGVFDIVMITHTAIMSGVTWLRIPSHRLTQARFDAMIQICEENRDNVPEGQRLLIAYVNREILGIAVPQVGAVRAFNPAQSTHTASVHRTVTQSAQRLKALYDDKITGTNLDKIIKEISIWLTATRVDSLEIMAAKRCLSRLTVGDYFFTDPGSQVSTKQLLAFAWLAIHDEEKRLGTLEDAKILFINGLYETQRGDNLSEAGVDNHHPDDESICPSGTFNKIMEKLCGLHPAVEVIYITSEGAGKKFKIVVNEAAMAYFRGFANTPEGHHQRLELIGKIKEPSNGNSAEPIWGAIKDEVTDRMFEEFKSLFNNNKRALEFSGLMNTGVDVPLNAANMAELEGMAVNVMPQEGAAVYFRQGVFFNASISSVGATADISAPGEDSPKP